MKRKTRLVTTAVSIVALIACWTYVPWNQTQTNGTGDGALKYDRLGYSFIWNAPKADKSLISQYSKTRVEPDWLILTVLSFVLVGIVFFAFPQKNE